MKQMIRDIATATLICLMILCIDKISIAHARLRADMNAFNEILELNTFEVNQSFEESMEW